MSSGGGRWTLGTHQVVVEEGAPSPVHNKTSGVCCLCQRPTRGVRVIYRWANNGRGDWQLVGLHEACSQFMAPGDEVSV